MFFPRNGGRTSPTRACCVCGARFSDSYTSSVCGSCDRRGFDGRDASTKWQNDQTADRMMERRRRKYEK